MKKKIKKFWSYKLSSKIADLISFTLGFVGLFFGLLSLLALLRFWNNSTFSYDFTVIAVIFDTLSAIFALLAFQLGISNYREKKEKLIANHFAKYELKAICLDLISFLLGTVGWTLELLSMFSLSFYWYDPAFSFDVTFAAIIINLASTLTALSAFTIIRKIHLS